jgi:hypothetical protein
MDSFGLPWIIAPATRRGVIDSRRLADGPLNLGTSGCFNDLVCVEFTTDGIPLICGDLGNGMAS